ncbi:MAG: trigger factor [Sulfuricellaceae bacterium]|nr:trigger factor [Sulfuricellaceae bacterium]
MQATMENVDTLEKRLDLSVAMAEIEAEAGIRLKRMARSVKMDGFRPGKVPMNVVAQQYGAQARQEALGEAVQSCFEKAVAEQKLKVAGYPQIEPRESGGDRFEFCAVFEVYPEVQLGDLGDVNIERPQASVGEADVDKTIEILRKQRVTYAPVERAAADDDQVNIDFRGTLNGEAFPGGEGKGAELVLGAGRWLKDFESQIVGMKAGESKTFDMDFPADYPSKELAGKTVSFAVTLNSVGTPCLPEVDAGFAKSLGVADGNLETMRSEVKGNLEREVKRRIQAQVKGHAMQALLDKAILGLPKALVDMEIGRLMDQAKQDLAARGVPVQNESFMRPELFADQARQRVKLGLILADLVEKHGLHAQPDQVRALVEAYAESFEHPEEVVRWVYSKSDELNGMASMALEENVVEWVMKQVKVTDKPVAFDELMGNA